jgi:hypothetical protein
MRSLLAKLASLVPVVVGGLLLVPADARAQDDEEEPNILQTEGTDCSEGATPIAGSSGFSNARNALRTTAQTYSAATYAEEHLFPAGETDETSGAFSAEFFQMINASSVPSYDDRAGTTINCPRKYRVNMRPLDLQAMAMGGSFSKGNFGGFYAASVAYGNPAMPNNIVRGMMLFAQPMYAGTTLLFAPLARNGLSTQQGASAFALDWVAGGTFTSSVASVRAADDPTQVLMTGAAWALSARMGRAAPAPVGW